MNRLFFIILSILLFSGCTNKIDDKKNIPADLIAKDQMVDVVVDLRLLDAIMNVKLRKKETGLDSVNVLLYNSIMEKHGITREQFERSLTFYQGDLKVLDEIYEQAITKLILMKPEKTEE